MAGAFQRARDEARQQGMQEGMQQGMQEGMQQGRQEGMQQGMQEGVRQGRVEGERAVLERLLRHRFGPVPAELAERLGRASADDLETWAENVLDAGKLDDVFDPDS